MTGYPICVIGASHVAAPRWAWMNARPHVCEDVSLTFFASPLRDFQRLDLIDGALVPRNDKQRRSFAMTSGGADRIVCADYKAFIVVGLGLSFVRTVGSGREMGTLAMRERAPVQRLVSEACFNAWLEDDVESSGAIALLKQIRALSDAPVFVSPQPCPAEDYAKGRPKSPFHADNPSLPDLYARFSAAADKAIARHGGRPIWQQPSTMRVPGLSKKRYHKNSARLRNTGQRRDGDRVHMNEAFGVLLLKDLFRELGVEGKGPAESAHLPPPSPPARRQRVIASVLRNWANCPLTLPA